MRIIIDRSRCIGSGTCVLTAPAIFDQDENDGIVTLLDPTPPAEQHEAAREAERLCPARVIEIVE